MLLFVLLIGGVVLYFGVMLFVMVVDDWLCFCGFNGSGVNNDGLILMIWSDNENFKWKMEFFGQGVFSLIIVGDKVFVICYFGYGCEGDFEDFKCYLFCVDWVSGDIVW